MFKTLPVVRGQDKIAYLWDKYHDAGYFCGGFVRWMASPLPSAKVKPYGDIDFYPKDSDTFASIERELTKQFNLKGGINIFVSPVATSFIIDALDTKLQLIAPQPSNSPIVTSGSLEAILGAFDFTVSMAGLKDLNSVIVHEDFVTHEVGAKLVIKNIHCPISIIKRIHKYLNKGYTITPLELYKLYIDWESRPKDYKLEMQDLMNKLDEADGNIYAMEDTEDMDRLKQLLYVD